MTANEALEVTVDRLRLGLAHLIVDADPRTTRRKVYEALERAHDELTVAIAEHRRGLGQVLDVEGQRDALLAALRVERYGTAGALEVERLEVERCARVARHAAARG